MRSLDAAEALHLNFEYYALSLTATGGLSKFLMSLISLKEPIFKVHSAMYD